MKLSHEFKMIIKTAFLSAFFTVVLLMLVNYYFNHSWNPFSSSSDSQLFTVTGTGTITKTPDEAQISFTVSQSAMLLKDAQNMANKQTNLIVSDLQKIGIPQKDIQTSNYSSSPNNQNGNTIELMPARIQPQQVSPSPNGYTVSEDISVTVENVNKAGEVIDTVTKDGAEDVNGPNLTFSDATNESLIDQARVQAILNAKQKAQSMASAAGIHLGRIVNIQDGNTPFLPVMPMMSGMRAAGGSSSVPTQINQGENTVTETVTLSYQTW